MTTRFNSGDDFGVQSGYSGDAVEDSIIAPCGIEDLDSAIFKMFDSEISFSVFDGKSGSVLKAPVIFAAGERWATLKRGQAIRDKNKNLILPLITIRKTGIDQSPDDITGRGINQQTGQLVVKRLLSKKDRQYQNIINKIAIKNQENASDENSILSSERDNVGENKRDLDIIDGGLLSSKYDNNIWEIITIPSPQFYTAHYEITFWAQYAVHINQMIEKLMSSYLPTSNKTLKIETDKGYWFIAKVDDSYSSKDNSEDSTDEERVIKYTFNVNVPAYLVASAAPGIPSAVRKFISAPFINFGGVSEADVELTNGFPRQDEQEYLANNPETPFLLNGESVPDGTNKVKDHVVTIKKNPFTGKNESKFLKVVKRNSKNGEIIMINDPFLKIDIYDE